MPIVWDENERRCEMTREEAIETLGHVVPFATQNGEKIAEAIDVAINALAVYPQYKWERDIALSQLEEYGIGFAEKKRDDLVEVVRCKDCDREYGSPVCPIQSQGWAINTDTFYCAWANEKAVMMNDI